MKEKGKYALLKKENRKYFLGLLSSVLYLCMAWKKFTAFFTNIPPPLSG
jgi:hypothetical protein